jgi:hypothetical protein
MGFAFGPLVSTASIAPPLLAGALPKGPLPRPRGAADRRATALSSSPHSDTDATDSSLFAASVAHCA